MKFAMAVLAALLFAGAVHADSYNTTLPPEVYTGYFYINAYYEWTAPDGLEMEQFFVNFPEPGSPSDFTAVWEYGPVVDFPPLYTIDPAQFGPNGPLNGPEPATYALLLVGIVGLLALRQHRIGAEDAEG